MKNSSFTHLLPLVVLLLWSVMEGNAFDRNDYRAYADTIRRQVWAHSLPEFQQPQKTNRFANKSAVILAAYDECILTTKARTLLSKGSAPLVSEILTRQMVQINDEVALKLYSEFDFLAFASRRVPFYGKMEVRRVLGVRIIKPDGSVREVSTDDYVISTEGKKGRDERQKLAVPGLSVGDIIDVFSFRYSKANDMDAEPMAFCFVEQFPMLSYRVHCEIDRRLAAQYRTLNGAPDFNLSDNDPDNHVLDVRVTNVERTEPSLWYERSMQTPFTLLYVQQSRPASMSYMSMACQMQGLQANPEARRLQEDCWQTWDNTQRFVALDKKEKAIAKEAVAKFSDPTERADYLYEYMSAYTLSNLLSDMSENYFICRLRNLFKKAGIDCQCGITTYEGREPIDLLANYDNAVWFLRLPMNGKCYFAPLFAGRPSEVPYQLQGRKAVVCTKANSKKLVEGPYEQMSFPQNEAQDNVNAVVLKAEVEGTQLRISRQQTLKGCVRQEASLFFPTRDEIVQSILGHHHSVKNRTDLYDQKYADLVAEQHGRDLDSQKETLLHEVLAYHGERPVEMGKPRVLTVGTTSEKPDLSYEVNYTMDGLVKRAGQNLMLSVGKLLGNLPKIEGTERERTADVVRSMPILCTWDVSIVLPVGYTIADDALKRLHADYENVTGGFHLEANVENDELHLNVRRVIAHKQEPMANWSQLLELYDRFAAIGSEQVVLSKRLP